MNFSSTPPNSSSSIAFDDLVTPPLTTPNSYKYQSPPSAGTLDTPNSLMNFTVQQQSEYDTKKRTYQQHHELLGHTSSKSCDIPTLGLSSTNLGPPFMPPDAEQAPAQPRPDMKRRRTEPNVHQMQVPAGGPGGLAALGLDVKGATSGVTPTGMMVLPEARNDEVWPPEVDEAFYEGLFVVPATADAWTDTRNSARNRASSWSAQGDGPRQAVRQKRAYRQLHTHAYRRCPLSQAGIVSHPSAQECAQE